jgi:hypothetical protein
MDVEQGLIGVALGLGCALCGYFIGRGNRQADAQAMVDSTLATLAAQNIIKLNTNADGDLTITAGENTNG